MKSTCIDQVLHFQRGRCNEGLLAIFKSLKRYFRKIGLSLVGMVWSSHTYFENRTQKICIHEASEQWGEMGDPPPWNTGPNFEFFLWLSNGWSLFQDSHPNHVWTDYLSLTAFSEICFFLFVLFLVLYSTVHAPLFRWCTLKTKVNFRKRF